MKRFIALLTLSLLAQNVANATDTCPTVELDKTEQSLENLPVWSQGPNPSCYVFSASFLATVWMRENWQRVDSSFINVVPDPNAEYQAIIHDTVASPTILDAENGRTCEAFQYILATEQKKTDAPADLLKLAGCTNWGTPLNADGTHKILETPESFTAKMHELLTSSNHPFPFGIEYCSSVLSNPSGSFITNRVFRPTLTYLNESASRENLANNCGFHSSAVIGQKLINGVCNFKIRNSWGISSSALVENGNYWVPADALARNTLRLIEVTSP